ncbi:LAFA_0A06942g1_1 [Lachancea sp. 'fantastica']|nr:LAFA_0A06942g1_1 [Lachancea sp. 'fantastica']
MSLNRSQREKFVATHIAHKYNLLHILPSIEQPQLAGLYLKSFYNGTKRNRLNLPDSITNGTKFCESCGVVHIAGVNLEMQVVEKEVKASAKPERTLEYKCLQCSTTKEFTLEAAERFREDLRTTTSQPTIKGTSARNVEPHTTENASMVKKQSSGKERAKRRKMNSLSNMLNKKKEAEASKKRSLTLSLDDFLQKN